MKRKKPLVGINTKLVADGADLYQKLDRHYVRAVERAGGVPVILPLFRSTSDARAYLERLDAVVFTGGPDLDPKRWNEPLHPKAELLHPERETSDFAALKAALALDLPVLAICCGAQELNVALGGSLHQHVPDLPGVKAHADGCVHEVALTESMTADILGTRRPSVNSYHHQACNKIGRGLRITAESPDGLVEGVESVRHRWVVGVQWHPERMGDDARQRRLFSAVVDAAKKP
ncbi:MAG TPA: gamma-glutamyl-gamma-aminobutyrate hydrolase family protein [Planctomycetota bacterium]